MSLFINVDLTEEMAQILVDLSISTQPANRASLCLYQGTMLTYAEYNALSDSDKMDIGLGTLPAYTPLASVDLQGIGSFIEKKHIDNNPAVSIKFGLNSDRYVVVNEGVPTWFVYYVGPTNNALYNTKGFSVVGTAGAVGSGADMEIVNNVLTAGQEFIFQDVNVVMPSNITTA